jgi:hypothetical protein
VPDQSWSFDHMHQSQPQFALGIVTERVDVNALADSQL